MRSLLLQFAYLVICILLCTYSQAQEIEKFSHRGGSGLMPENTVIAMKNALDFRTNLEMDLYLSKDGQVLVYHDSHVSSVIASYPDGRPVTKQESLGLKVVDLDYNKYIKKFRYRSTFQPNVSQKEKCTSLYSTFC